MEVGGGVGELSFSPENASSLILFRIPSLICFSDVSVLGVSGSECVIAYFKLCVLTHRK